MKDEYISISEFAKRAGVSRPTIYNRLEGDLAGFCKTVNGKKTINTAALRLFEVKVSSELTPWDILMQQQKMIEATNRELRSELEMKNEQIKQLNERLAETTAALVSAQKLAEGAQALHAGTITQQLAAGEPEQEVVEVTSAIEPTPEQPDAPAPIGATSPNPARPWWRFWK